MLSHTQTHITLEGILFYFLLRVFFAEIVAEDDEKAL